MIYGIINVLTKKTYLMDHAMDYTNYTTERRVQHLTFEERVIIQTRCNDGWNNN